MDVTRRHITKIGREVNRFVNRSVSGFGVGTSEYEFLHAVRKNPGVTQAGVRERLGLDSGRRKTRGKPGGQGLSDSQTQSARRPEQTAFRNPQGGQAQMFPRIDGSGLLRMAPFRSAGRSANGLL